MRWRLLGLGRQHGGDGRDAIRHRARSYHPVTPSPTPTAITAVDQRLKATSDAMAQCNAC